MRNESGFEEKTALISGLNVAYKTIGDGRPFLILHGWGSRADNWVRTAERISQFGVKVIIPDLPGFGKTEAQKNAWGVDEYLNFVKNFADSLGLKSFYILGHSFGGGLALKFTVKFPDKVDKLFLAAAACFRRETGRKMVLRKTAKFFKVLCFLPFYSFFRRAFYKFIVGRSDYVHLREGPIKNSYLKIIQEDLSPVLPLVQKETIIIWGDKDSITPLKNAYLIKEKIKRSKLIIVPGQNHDLERKAPKELSDIVISNLK